MEKLRPGCWGCNIMVGNLNNRNHSGNRNDQDEIVSEEKLFFISFCYWRIWIDATGGDILVDNQRLLRRK